MFVLIMNDMREPNVENVRSVKVADTREELVKFYNEHLTDYYSDGKWGKTFRKGSPLEWYNPVDLDRIGAFGDGIHELVDGITKEQAENVYRKKGGGWMFPV